MIVRPTRFYRLAEIFFDEEPSLPDADVVEYIQRPLPMPGTRCREFSTLHLDLTRDESTLLAGLSRNCRAALRRAPRDEIADEVWSPASSRALQEFIDFFNRFAGGKGLAPAPADRLSAFHASSALDLSVATQDGRPLVWHAYLRTPDRVLLLHSASLFRESSDSKVRNLIGRANRVLHWRDIVRYKEAGLPLLDFGGWYPGTEDQQLLGVNRFKAEFGATLVREYHCEVAASNRGRLVLLARRLRRRSPAPLRRTQP